MDLMKTIPKDMSTDVARLSLQYGIGEHNFDDADGKLICEGLKLDDASIKDILDYGPLAQEISAIVSGYNGPLAKRSA
jgi:hypothetical protein